MHRVPLESPSVYCSFVAGPWFLRIRHWFSHLLPFCLCSGQLLWRRFATGRTPSHHSLRAASMQLLPLIEMYCKWELQEDCSNLGELMRRFDNKEELQSHDLGRSMLQMIRDDDAGVHELLPRSRFTPASNPFDAIRSTLAAVDTALQGMQPQVHAILDVVLLHVAHIVSSCDWKTQSTCVHSGLCPIPFNGKLYLPSPLLSLRSLLFCPLHLWMCI